MSKPRSTFRGRLYLAAAAAAVLVAALLAFRESPLPVEMAQAERRDVAAYIAEDAETRLADEYILDMPVAGRLRRIELDEGAEVKAGQIVAEVDPFDLDQEIAQVRAQIRQAEAQTVGVDTAKPKDDDIARARIQIAEMRDALAMMRQDRSVAAINRDDAKREFDRMEAMRRSGVVSQSEFDRADRAYRAAVEEAQRAEIAVAAAEKNVAMAEKSAAVIEQSVGDNEYMRDYHEAQRDLLTAQLRMLEDDRARTAIASPIDGVLLEKRVESSLTLPAGTEVAVIGDMAGIEIECDILSEEVVRIAEGGRVVISGKALAGREIEGRVARIYPAGFEKISSLGIEQQRVRVIIAFDNAEANLRPGTSVDVRIITDERENVVAVPEPAAFRRDGAWYVFAVENGRAKLREVQLGVKNDDYAEITQGLTEGQTVIAETRNDLTDNARVEPLAAP